MNLQDNIKFLCKKKGISVAKLEQTLGFGNGSLTKCYAVRSDRLYDIAKYFDVSMEYLLTGQENEEEKSAPHISARALKLIALLEGLPDDSLDEIEKFAEYQRHTHQSDS